MITFEAGEPTGPNEPEPSAEALALQARQAVEALARLSDPAAFSELLRLSALVGESLGVSARSLADGGSWANVAEVAGVTRQAAWSRWRSETP
ncbi:MAG TPA: hypothetical protein VI030_16325 [Propionibacteriaceae bacterium]|jgi:hypothetical protein